jgi:hypothetical protein
VFASVAGGTETSADAPADAEPELEALVDVAPALVPVEATWNGAEKRCGLVKSLWFEKIPSTHWCAVSHNVPLDTPRSVGSGKA